MEIINKMLQNGMAVTEDLILRKKHPLEGVIST